ncbi:HNH endonuclease [Nonomuraea wenchangensis]|uniref:HNH endonuclease n=1 Tax=Nonomuraea wenchangensis TaxID=568860 RepID=UPI00384FA482
MVLALCAVLAALVVARTAPVARTRAETVRAPYGPVRKRSVRVRADAGRVLVSTPAPHLPGGEPAAPALWWYLPAVAGLPGPIPPVRYRRPRRGSTARWRSRRRHGVRRWRPRQMRGEYGRIFRCVLACRDGARCFYCWAPFVDPATEATFDHFLPSALWVTRRHNAPWNVVLACRECNSAKGGMLPAGLVLALLSIAAAAPSAAAGEMPLAA